MSPSKKSAEMQVYALKRKRDKCVMEMNDCHSEWVQWAQLPTIRWGPGQHNQHVHGIHAPQPVIVATVTSWFLTSCKHNKYNDTGTLVTCWRWQGMPVGIVTMTQLYMLTGHKYNGPQGISSSADMGAPSNVHSSLLSGCLLFRYGREKKETNI